MKSRRKDYEIRTTTVSILGRESQVYAAEISLLASRKAGEILSQLERSDGGRPKQKTRDNVSPVSRYRQTLQETSTSVRTAQRWQELAKVPHATVRDFINETKCNPDLEISLSGLLKKAKTDAAKKTPRPIVAPEKLVYTASEITARFTVLLSAY